MATLMALTLGVFGSVATSASIYGIVVAFSGNHANPAGLFSVSMAILAFGVALLVLAYLNFQER